MIKVIITACVIVTLLYFVTALLLVAFIVYADNIKRKRQRR